MENDFLKNLDASQVREIVESMYPREFEKGSFVIREGDAGKCSIHLLDCRDLLKPLCLFVCLPYQLKVEKCHAWRVLREKRKKKPISNIPSLGLARLLPRLHLQKGKGKKSGEKSAEKSSHLLFIQELEALLCVCSPSPPHRLPFQMETANKNRISMSSGNSLKIDLQTQHSIKSLKMVRSSLCYDLDLLFWI